MKLPRLILLITTKYDLILKGSYENNVLQLPRLLDELEINKKQHISVQEDILTTNAIKI